MRTAGKNIREIGFYIFTNNIFTYICLCLIFLPPNFFACLGLLKWQGTGKQCHRLRESGQNNVLGKKIGGKKMKIAGKNIGGKNIGQYKIYIFTSNIFTYICLCLIFLPASAFSNVLETAGLRRFLSREPDVMRTAARIRTKQCFRQKNRGQKNENSW